MRSYNKQSLMAADSRKAGIIPIVLALIVVIVAAIVVWMIYLAVSGPETDVSTIKAANAEVAAIREGQLAGSEETADGLRALLATSQEEAVLLREKVARLEVGVEGGLLLAEREKALDAREVRLSAQEDAQVRIQANLDTRETSLVKREREFYSATNVTQQEIGEAREMRQNHNRLVADLGAERDINRGLLLDLQTASREVGTANASAWKTIFNVTIILVFLVVVGIIGGLYQIWRIKGYRKATSETRTITGTEAPEVLAEVSRIESANPGLLESAD